MKSGNLNLERLFWNVSMPIQTAPSLLTIGHLATYWRISRVVSISYVTFPDIASHDPWGVWACIEAWSE
ncbi:unnamed protein product [Protopolystoma xenopodis]|uniref:Uncharacterized protein n=1 Tax=Protopolystoma xenopodis TaxID=117903 RepID=A0A448WW94_9PLAT|nr:unnamed protein product [Protopolystoma xenopodis]